MIHHAQSWKTSTKKYKKEADKATTKLDEVEILLADAQKKLAEAQAQVIELEEEKENTIDHYMDSKEYKKLMMLHDEEIYPDYYQDGWDGALKAVAFAHPGVLNLEDFPCPSVKLPVGTYHEAEAGEEERRIIDPEEPLHESSPTASGESPSKTASEGGSKGPTETSRGKRKRDTSSDSSTSSSSSGSTASSSSEEDTATS